MAYTTPVLGATTLPNPSDFEKKRAFRGSMTEMADGSVAFDVVSTNVKHAYTLKWAQLDDTDKGKIETAYDAMKTASVSFTPPDGSSAATVTRTETEPTFVMVTTALGLRWNVTLELREV